jgi:hypothetical protein
MRRFVSNTLFVMLASLVVQTNAQTSQDKTKDAQRHVETAGGFSYIPPDGWVVRTFPGLKFKVAVGPVAGGFAANLNVVDEEHKGSLEDYVKANQATLERLLAKFRLIKKDDFRGMDDLPGVRMIIENEQGGKALRQTFFFFANSNTKFVITGSTLADGGDKLDAAFENSMKSFRFEKKYLARRLAASAAGIA